MSPASGPSWPTGGGLNGSAGSPGCPSTLDHSHLALGGLGVLRAGLRRCGRLRRRRAERLGRDVLLILAAGARLSSYVAGTIGEIGFLRGVWLDGSRRLVWLEDYVAALNARADVDVPDRIAEGIRLEEVSFRLSGQRSPGC